MEPYLTLYWHYIIDNMATFNTYYIPGISAYFHDSAAVILKDGQLLYAAEEERFSRIKHDNSFPVLAIEKGLEVLKLTLSDIDTVVYYEKPFLKFERILESYYKLAPKGFISFTKSMPRWLGEKLNIRANIWKSLKQIGSIEHLKKQFIKI